ncbi:proteasome assembly chaperone family protein [Methanobacterium formicicum]|uniref:Proteasome assembly chaperone family protein n=1 Tax=Methanobacterium formicicum TaxID=2162 RepID=A0A843AHW4_METFO|nr:proteasome assembly chaperone family protein [Methanobacterium formicicum]MBF4474747.1 proteasome assembly chaperone family protein [Methanobacterium formicicum]MDG3548382.1 proteasome assembly chaperone family protein [Methanobacterium formicicum]
MVQMVETEVECCKIISKDIENATVIEGSPELGLIGNIVGWLLVEELKMEEIGHIESKHFPPLAVLYRGVAIHPFRIYNADDVVLFLSDFVVPPDVTYDMTNVIVEWMKRNNSKELITLNSIAVPQKINQVAAAANSFEGLERLGKLDLPILPFGNVNGISGTLLTRTRASEIPASCLFAEVLNQYPDPRAAASVVDVLNRMLNINVNSEPLLKEAEEIETRLKELAQAVQGEGGSQAYG